MIIDYPTEEQLKAAGTPPEPLTITEAIAAALGIPIDEHPRVHVPKAERAQQPSKRATPAIRGKRVA